MSVELHLDSRTNRLAILSLFLLAIGCEEEDTIQGAVYLTSGLETGIWTTDPPPVSLQIDQIAQDGTVSTMARLSVPKSDAEVPAFELGTGAAAIFQATGNDAAGNPVVKGRTWYLDPSSLKGYMVPMFVGRVGFFSRPPYGFPVAQGDFPPVETCAGRFVISAGTAENGQIRVDGYDVGVWAYNLTSKLDCPREPCQVKSLAVVDGSSAVLVGTDWAITRNFSTTLASQEVTIPDGMSGWAEIAGGSTVHDPGSGSVYIVGGTRPVDPTSTVLRVTTDGVLTTLRLLQPRAGAAATWVKERGLVVVGGSSEAPGAELLAVDAGTFSELPFPADPTTGAGLLGVDTATVVRAGGKDATGGAAASSRLSLVCSADCALEPAGDPVELDRPTGFDLDSAHTLWIGTDAQGYTVGRKLGTSVEAVPLRQPRLGGSVLELSTGQYAVVGGHFEDGTAALTLELFQP